MGRAKVLVPTFGVVARADRDRFNQRRLAGAVFAHEERDAGVELKLGQRGNGGDREWIRGEVSTLVSNQLQMAQDAIGRKTHALLAKVTARARLVAADSASLRTVATPWARAVRWRRGRS